MMFIMGNAYQSLIISSMSLSREGVRLGSFDELFSSETELLVDEQFFNVLTKSGDFEHVLKRMEVILNIQYEELLRSRKALVARCDLLVHAMKFNEISELGSHFYLLSDQKMPFYEKFSVAKLSPFYEKLQTYHDYIYESGIRQHVRFMQEKEKVAERKREESYMKDEKYLLSINDLNGVFYILLGGFVISALCLLIEIFWHDCLRNFDVRRFYKECLRKFRAERQTRMRVRKIRVRPIEV